MKRRSFFGVLSALPALVMGFGKNSVCKEVEKGCVAPDRIGGRMITVHDYNDYDGFIRLRKWEHGDLCVVSLNVLKLAEEVKTKGTRYEFCFRVKDIIDAK